MSARTSNTSRSQSSPQVQQQQQVGTPGGSASTTSAFSLLLETSHHDGISAAHNARFCERARLLWAEHRTQWMNTARQGLNQHAIALPPLQSVLFSAFAFKDKSSRRFLILTDGAIFVSKGDDVTNIRCMIPLHRLAGVLASPLHMCNENGDRISETNVYRVQMATKTSSSGSSHKLTPPLLTLDVSERSKVCFLYYLEKQYEYVTARLLRITESPDDAPPGLGNLVSNSTAGALSIAEDWTAAAQRISTTFHCKLLVWAVTQNTQPFVDTLSAMSLLRCERDRRLMQYIARSLLTIASRSNFTERLLYCCLRWEIQLAKDGVGDVDAHLWPMETSIGGFLRTDSVAAHVVLEYMDSSSTGDAYLWQTLHQAMEVFFNSKQGRLFNEEEVEGWATYLLTPLANSHDSELFPREVRTVCRLVEEVETTYSKIFIADCILAHFVCRGIRHPVKLGAILSEPKPIYRFNLNRVTRLIEALGNHSNRNPMAHRFFAASKEPDGDEDAIHFLLHSPIINAVVPRMGSLVKTYIGGALFGEPSRVTVQGLLAYGGIQPHPQLLRSGATMATSDPGANGGSGSASKVSLLTTKTNTTTTTTAVTEVEGVDLSAHDGAQLLALHDVLGDKVVTLLCMMSNHVLVSDSNRRSGQLLATMSVAKEKPARETPVLRYQTSSGFAEDEPAADLDCDKLLDAFLGPSKKTKPVVRRPHASSVMAGPPTPKQAEETAALRAECATLRDQLMALQVAHEAQKAREIEAINTLTQYHSIIEQKNREITRLRQNTGVPDHRGALLNMSPAPAKDASTQLGSTNGHSTSRTR